MRDVLTKLGCITINSSHTRTNLADINYAVNIMHCITSAGLNNTTASKSISDTRCSSNTNRDGIVVDQNALADLVVHLCQHFGQDQTYLGHWSTLDLFCSLCYQQQTRQHLQPGYPLHSL